MFRWKCADRRKLIRLKGSFDPLQPTHNSMCQWNKNFTVTPGDLECVIRYCDNATTAPNTPHNYNFDWNWWNGGNVIPINTYVRYPCKTDHAVQQNVDWDYQAATYTLVLCQANGELAYPDPWPECLDENSVFCPDPGDSAGITRVCTDLSCSDLVYRSQFTYTCDDPRKWIKRGTYGLTDLRKSMNTRCRWRGTYNVDGTDLECVMHHCRHPHNEAGSHNPPPAENRIELVDRSNWTIPFTSSVTYRCPTGTYIEDTGLDDVGPAEIDVECITDVGTYDTPAQWPNCTETVVCGQPPEPDVNVTRTWLNSAPEFQETYNTHVHYQCQDGSKFDTNNDGVGDEAEVTIRCLWNKAWSPTTGKSWSPVPTMPQCIVTHCVEPFIIPDYTFLEAVTNAWTPINTNKQYRCKDQMGDVPRMFWETDRSRSTFELPCNPDGYFTWLEWPTCLTDVTCSPDPPLIPTDPEYTLASDDGTVTINSLEYPTYPMIFRTENLIKNSSYSNLDIPKNYMANLT